MNETCDFRILIVDDIPENMEIIGTTLEKEGYDLYIADSGVSALELVAQVEFDLVLLDIMMPDMDGFEILHQLRDMPYGQSVPVILLTGKVEIESIVKGFEMGAVDYIRKPFNMMELKARVRRQVEQIRDKQSVEKKNRYLESVIENIESYAGKDLMTGLYNRGEMLNRIRQEQNRYERSRRMFSVAIVSIECRETETRLLEDFLTEQVLIELVKLFIERIRKQDILGRWDENEFMLVLPETDAEGARVLLEELRTYTERKSFVGKNQEVIRLTVNASAAVYDRINDTDEFILSVYQRNQDG